MLFNMINSYQNSRRMVLELELWTWTLFLFKNSKSIYLLKDYSTGSQQQVKIGETFSTWKCIKRGVPQGSVMGPTFFNLFVNDLFYHLKQATLNAHEDDDQINNSNICLLYALQPIVYAAIIFCLFLIHKQQLMAYVPFPI